MGRNSLVIIFAVVAVSIVSPITGQSEMVYAVCPPVIKMISSSPGHRATDVPVDVTITLEWDKTILQNLSDNIRDLKPALESINIAGGRYGIGTLLTTEWGIGGNVVWEDNKEVITPEAPLEPGTQYRVWTYLYMTMRNDKIEYCPGIGGEVIFRTAGVPAEDIRPIRNFDLSSLYHGDEFGRALIQGPVTNLNLALRVVTVKDKSRGTLNLVVYDGTPLMRQGNMLSLNSIKVGDIIEVTVTGGRVSMIVLLDVEH